MSYFILFLILSSYVLQSKCAYTLVWSDEFNGNTLDTNAWNIEVTDQVYNNEKEAYTAKNVVVQNGSLQITALNQTYLSKKYTSGRINTNGLQTFTYGRFEASMKLPKGKGFWPAFWLYPIDAEDDDTLPYREIDIMEAIGSQPKTIETTCWTGGTYDVPIGIGSDYTMSTDFSLAYHNYSAVWIPGEINYYVDGVNVFSCLESDSQAWALDKPTLNQLYIIFNLAVGGDDPGNPSSTTPFPSTMYVDYVRVYQDNKVSGNVAITSLGEKVMKKKKSEDCDERYTSSNLKNSVRYLKSEGKVVTSPMDTIDVETHTDCCEKCDMKEKCVAWKFMKGKCVFFSKD